MGVEEFISLKAPKKSKLSRTEFADPEDTFSSLHTDRDGHVMMLDYDTESAAIGHVQEYGEELFLAAAIVLWICFSLSQLVRGMKSG